MLRFTANCTLTITDCNLSGCEDPVTASFVDYGGSLSVSEGEGGGPFSYEINGGTLSIYWVGGYSIDYERQ
jgi:hypothetical protein